MISTSSLSDPTDLLVLGAGWTSTFLLPLLSSSTPPIPHIATTRDGRGGTLKWAFDPSESAGGEQYEVLPKAKTVLITFPLKGEGVSRRLVEGYEKIHGRVRWIQLGSTGIWDAGPTLQGKKKSSVWMDRHSAFDLMNQRGLAEEELLSVSADSFVLNLCGLWGGTRDLRNWIPRVAATKEALAGKTSVHLIHGLDVARSIIAVHLSPPTPPTNSSSITLPSFSHAHRYLITDLRVYDWWDLILSVVPPSSPTSVWVQELIQETDVRGLPRSPAELGRALDSTEFWETFGLRPEKGRWEAAKL